MYGDESGSASYGVSICDGYICDIATLDILNSFFRNEKTCIRTSHCMKRLFLCTAVLHVHVLVCPFRVRMT